MGIDNKYGRVTVERSTIAEDEPVVVMRAQDRLLPDVLRYYEGLCEKAGSPEHHLQLIRKTRDIVRAWQKEHFTKTPESEGIRPLTTEENEAISLAEALEIRR